MKVDEEARKKTWAPRSRKGCQTCRARRIKCDEGQPACKKCVTGGRSCVYVETPPPRKDDAKETRRRRKELPVLISKAALYQKEPPAWDLSQAMLFFATVLVPQFDRRQVATTAYQAQFPPRPHVSAFLFPNCLLLLATSHRIKMISAQRGVPVRRGQGLGIEHLWHSYFTYMARGLEHLNENIMARSPARYVLHRTIDLLSNELPIMNSLWRSHLKGFFAIVAMYGGVDTIIVTSAKQPFLALNYGLVFAVYGNACSPAHNQLDGLYAWSDEDILRVYTYSFYSGSPCPSAVFLSIHHITQLRLLIATQKPADDAASTAADAIAHRLHDFSAVDWVEPYELPPDALRPMLAALFKTAAILYGLLALPWDLARPLAGPHWENAKTAEAARRWYRKALLNILGPTAKRIQATLLAWPVAVLGAAYADGPEDEQEMILDQLRAMLRMEDVLSGPGTMLELFPAYWASGTVGWEECYYKPTQVL